MKTPNDVEGVKKRCPSYEQCPLCYGCRNYNPARLQCVILCGSDKKRNICNTEKHQAKVLNKMIVKEAIVVE